MSMTQFDRPGATLDRQAKRRAPSSRLADLGDRIARTFAPSTDAGHAAPWEASTEAHDPVGADVGVPWDEPEPAFPVVRSGYDPKAVDEYVNELEREIDELRARASSDGAVADEIKRIGEQTAAILQTAHQQAHETRRKAQAEADKCLSDAAANAIAMNEEAKQKLRHLDSETDAVWHERVRLIEDVRNVATALFSLAEDAFDRFPPEEEKRAAIDPSPVRAVDERAGEGEGQASVPGGEPQPSVAGGVPQPSVAGGVPQPSVAGGVPQPSVPGGVPQPSVPGGLPQPSVPGRDDDVRGLDDGGDRGPFLQP
jgi:DivIVA protein